MTTEKDYRASAQHHRDGPGFRMRLAQPGDEGIIIGLLSHDGTGFGRLAIHIAVDEVAFVQGRWLDLRDMLDAHAWEKVSVATGPGSFLGFHEVRVDSEQGKEVPK